MELIPNVSTYLRVLIDTIDDCTFGKVYFIEEWILKDNDEIYYQITDDVGNIRHWYYYEHDVEVEDASFEVNLQKILE